MQPGVRREGGRRSAARDAVAPELIRQRRRLHAEEIGSSTLTRDSTTCLLERRGEVLALAIAHLFCGEETTRRCRGQRRDRAVERRARCRLERIRRRDLRK